MSKLSETVNLKNFEATVKMLEEKMNDLLYLNPKEDFDSGDNQRIRLLADKFDDFGEESWFSERFFLAATKAADQLNDELIDARNKLLSAKASSKEEAQAHIKEFEETVQIAMKKHMLPIRLNFSTGNEFYGLIRPYILPLIEKINALYNKIAGGDLIFDSKDEDYLTASGIKQEITNKYRMFSKSLEEEAPAPKVGPATKKQ